MGKIFFEQPRSPTPIDRGNPFGARTQAFFTPFGHMLDVGRSKFHSTLSGPSVQPDRVGKVLSIATLGGSANYQEFSSAGIDLSGPFTMAIRARRIASSSANYDRVFHSNGANSGNSRFAWLLAGSGDSNPDRLYFFAVDSAGTSKQNVYTTYGALSTTQYETYVAVWDGANLTFYRNGKLESTVAATTFLAASLPNTIRFGTDTSGSIGAAVRVSFVHIMKGALSTGEVASYFANPWQIFRPLPAGQPAFAVAAGATLAAPFGHLGTAFNGGRTLHGGAFQ